MNKDILLGNLRVAFISLPPSRQCFQRVCGFSRVFRQQIPSHLPPMSRRTLTAKDSPLGSTRSRRGDAESVTRSKKSTISSQDASPPTDSPMRVVIRLSPPSNYIEGNPTTYPVVHADASRHNVVVVDGCGEFAADSVVREDVEQSRVFSIVGRRLCDKVLSGKDAALLAFGPRGSGKCHTVLGQRVRNDEEPGDDVPLEFLSEEDQYGLLARCVDYIANAEFREKDSMHERRTVVLLTASEVVSGMASDFGKAYVDNIRGEQGYRYVMNHADEQGERLEYARQRFEPLMEKVPELFEGDEIMPPHLERFESRNSIRSHLGVESGSTPSRLGSGFGSRSNSAVGSEFSDMPLVRLSGMDDTNPRILGGLATIVHSGDEAMEFVRAGVEMRHALAASPEQRDVLAHTLFTITYLDSDSHGVTMRVSRLRLGVLAGTLPALDEKEMMTQSFVERSESSSLRHAFGKLKMFLSTVSEASKAVKGKPSLRLDPREDERQPVLMKLIAPAFMGEKPVHLTLMVCVPTTAARQEEALSTLEWGTQVRAGRKAAPSQKPTNYMEAQAQGQEKRIRRLMDEVAFLEGELEKTHSSYKRKITQLTGSGHMQGLARQGVFDRAPEELVTLIQQSRMATKAAKDKMRDRRAELLDVKGEASAAASRQESEMRKVKDRVAQIQREVAAMKQQLQHLVSSKDKERQTAMEEQVQSAQPQLATSGPMAEFKRTAMRLDVSGHREEDEELEEEMRAIELKKEQEVERIRTARDKQMLEMAEQSHEAVAKMDRFQMEHLARVRRMREERRRLVEHCTRLSSILVNCESSAYPVEECDRIKRLYLPYNDRGDGPPSEAVRRFLRQERNLLREEQRKQEEEEQEERKRRRKEEGDEEEEEEEEETTKVPAPYEIVGETSEDEKQVMDETQAFLHYQYLALKQRCEALKGLQDEDEESETESQLPGASGMDVIAMRRTMMQEAVDALHSESTTAYIKGLRAYHDTLRRELREQSSVNVHLRKTIGEMQ